MTATHVIDTLGDAYLNLFEQPEPPKVEAEEKEGEKKEKKSKTK